MTGHKSARKGQRVLVHLSTGGKIVGKFIEHRDKEVSIEVIDKISERPMIVVFATKYIRTISIYKGAPKSTVKQPPKRGLK